MSESTNSGLMTIKQAANIFGLSQWCLYQAIKIDPSFPVVKVRPARNSSIPGGTAPLLAAKETDASGKKGSFYSNWQ